MALAFAKGQELCRFFCFYFVTDQMGLVDLCIFSLWRGHLWVSPKYLTVFVRVLEILIL